MTDRAGDYEAECSTAQGTSDIFLFTLVCTAPEFRGPLCRRLRKMTRIARRRESRELSQKPEHCRTEPVRRLESQGFRDSQEGRGWGTLWNIATLPYLLSSAPAESVPVGGCACGLGYFNWV